MVAEDQTVFWAAVVPDDAAGRPQTPSVVDVLDGGEVERLHRSL